MKFKLFNVSSMILSLTLVQASISSAMAYNFEEKIQRFDGAVLAPSARALVAKNAEELQRELIEHYSVVGAPSFAEARERHLNEFLAAAVAAEALAPADREKALGILLTHPLLTAEAVATLAPRAGCGEPSGSSAPAPAPSGFERTYGPGIYGDDEAAGRAVPLVVEASRAAPPATGPMAEIPAGAAGSEIDRLIAEILRLKPEYTETRLRTRSKAVLNSILVSLQQAQDTQAERR